MVWCSHCEVQVQQIENDTISGETDPVDMLNRLNEDLQVLSNARDEIRELGRALIRQGTADMQPQLDEYLKTEDDVLLKLAQMQVRIAQKDQERQNTADTSALSTAVGNVSLSDSGIYSYALEPESMQGVVTSFANNQSAVSFAPPTLTLARSSVPERTSSKTEMAVPPSRPVEVTIPAATGAKPRTYADVAKTPAMLSPTRTPPPPVSIKSDTQRHLELALDEWRQRLARLDHLIKTSISTEPSPDAANEIVGTTQSADMSNLNSYEMFVFVFLLGSNGCYLSIIT